MTVLGDLQYETVDDVASLLEVAPVTYREWFRRGRAPGVKLPGTRRILVPRADLEAWLAGADLETKTLSHGGRLVQAKPPAKRRAAQ